MSNCILDCGGQVVSVASLYSNKDIVRRRPVGVCDTCGHVQIAPLYTAEEQQRINSLWHDHFVSGNAEQNKKKIQATYGRIKGYASSGRMLDVGGGEGWGQEVAYLCGMQYAVIEPMIALHDGYRAKAIDIAGQNIESIREHYDVIIFRHVLEHLLSPVTDLKKLANSLAPNGVIYIALPDFEALNGRKGYRTNSLRPVHVSYFTLDKLLWLTARVGLKPLVTGTDGELWGVFTRGECNYPLNNESKKNMSRLKREVLKNYLKDVRRILSFLRK